MFRLTYNALAARSLSPTVQRFETESEARAMVDFLLNKYGPHAMWWEIEEEKEKK